MNWESSIICLFLASLVRPLVLFVAALIVLRVARIRHPASQHAVWTAVLIGMLLLPGVSAIVPHLNLAVLPATHSSFPVVPQHLEAPSRLERAGAQIVAEGPQGAEAEVPFVAADETPVRLAPNTPQPSIAMTATLANTPRTAMPRPATLLLWLYVAGLVATAVYQIAGEILLRRVIRQSQQLRSRRLRESDNVTVPIAVGLFNPSVILPRDWRQWSLATRRSVLAHEFAHIRRKDLLVSTLARVARCVLWFHPLAWWVSKRISQLAEMACDAAALERKNDPAAYSRMLLEFAGRVSQAGYRAVLPGLTIAGAGSLSGRIDQVFALSNRNLRKLKRPAMTLVLIGGPVLCVSATLGVAQLKSGQKPVEAPAFATATLETAGATPLATPLLELAMAALGAQPQPEPQQSGDAATTRAFLDRYCVACHSEKAQQRYGDITLDDKDVARVRENAGIWEKVVHKMQSGLEHVVLRGYYVQPEAAARKALVTWLTSELDRNAPPYMPPPGIHRLNRTEYGNAIRDLLALEIDPATFLPADDSSSYFDTMARSLGTSSALAEAYTTAAGRISRSAMGITDPLSNAVDTPSRRRVLVCRPTSDADEIDCVQRIITNLATNAFRRPPTTEDVNFLFDVYRQIRGSDSLASIQRFRGFERTFDNAIEAVLRNILMDRKFLYRVEVEPANLQSGQSYRISDLDLASRLSFFLWSRGPDDPLIDLANRGQLRDPSVLERETRRMLRDPRAEALALNFASQWFNFRGLASVPLFPGLDQPLRQAMQREGELFFDSIVREDRNVVDLLNADYTFLNERLAQHYGIPNVLGSEFRRVALGPAFDVRRGLLGKAAILTTTSYGDGSRTSIVFRGDWVLQRILGVDYPLPPPNVPPLGPNATDGRTVRQTMELHEVNDWCKDCHRFMDPIGIALENFDRIGMWRTQDRGMPLDVSSELLDGTKINGPVDLRNALLARSDQFTQTLVMRLLTYALGRGADYPDMPLIRSIVRDAARDNNRFSTIVLGIVKSAPFQMNAKYAR